MMHKCCDLLSKRIFDTLINNIGGVNKLQIKYLCVDFELKNGLCFQGCQIKEVGIFNSNLFCFLE